MLPNNVRMPINILDLNTGNTSLHYKKGLDRSRVLSSTTDTGGGSQSNKKKANKNLELKLNQNKSSRLYFTSKVFIGPKKTPYDFLILTDSPVSLIKDEDCDKKELKEICANVIGNAEFEYEKNSMTKASNYFGKVVKADLWLTNEIVSKDNYFLVIKKDAQDVVVDYPFLGLGFSNGKYHSFLEHLKSQKLIDELAFSFYFNLHVEPQPILYLGSLN